MPMFQGASGIDARGSTFNDVAGNQTNITNNNIQNIIPGERQVHASLNPIYDAGYDRTSRSGPVSRCYKGTREKVIAKIVQHAKVHNNRPICWLSGPAGAGKSAISQTIAEQLATEKRLAASYFFFRGTGSRNKISRFIPTLAYQLSISVPSTTRYIQRLLEVEPTILTSQSPRHQFQKLIIEPFLAVNPPLQTYLPWKKPMVIVLDALDECDDRDSMAEFIEMLINVFQEYRRLNLRIMITSRIEEHIRKKLDAAPTTVYRLSLLDFDAQIDIRHFFRSRFATIYDENTRLLKNEVLPWPSDPDVDSLVKKADGSFIFADTLMKLMDHGHGLPQEKLRKALTAEAGLDELYKQVLSDVPRDGDFKRVIGTVILLIHPLPVTSLGQLLQLRSEEIVQALLGTQSIIMIPDDDSEPIRLYHTSLRDLLVSQSRSGRLFVDPPTRHFSIALDCLAVLVMQPAEGIFYTGGQKYACLNWFDHIRLSSIGGDNTLVPWSEVMRLLEDFAGQPLNYWVNTLLLDGRQAMKEIMHSVKSLRTVPDCPDELVKALKRILKQVNVRSGRISA